MSDQIAVFLDIRDNVLRLVLYQLLVRHGYLAVTDRAGATIWVTDRLGMCTVVDVLVVEVTPFRAAVALAALQAGETRAVVAADRLEDLLGVLRGLDAPVVSVPYRVLEAARKTQPLTTRQREILRRLALGGTTATFAKLVRHLRISEATLRWEIARLRALAGVDSRRDLGCVARRIGFPPS